MFASPGALGASQNFWGAYVCACVSQRVETACWPPACWAMMSSCLAVAFNSWKQAALELGLKGPGAPFKQSTLLIWIFSLCFYMIKTPWVRGLKQLPGSLLNSWLEVNGLGLHRCNSSNTDTFFRDKSGSWCHLWLMWKGLLNRSVWFDSQSVSNGLAEWCHVNITLKSLELFIYCELG